MLTSSDKKFKPIFEIVLFSFLFLFFFQLVTTFIESIYMIDLLNTALDEYVLGLVFLLFSAFLFILNIKGIKTKITDKKDFNENFITIFGIIMVVSRLLTPLFDTKPKMIFSGFGAGLFLIFFPFYLTTKKKEHEEKSGIQLGISLALSVLLSILFRTLNSTVDISMYKGFQAISWIMGCFSIWILLFYSRNEKGENIEKNNTTTEEEKFKGVKLIGLILGLFSIFSIIYFAFESPTVISRWTEGNYIAITTVLCFSLGISVILLLFKPDIISKIDEKWNKWNWNGFFVICLVLTILSHTIQFPTTIDSLPIIVSSPLWYQQIPMYLMLITSPIIFIDFIILIRQIIKLQPKLSQITWGFVIGEIYFILLIFIFIFTNIWGYVGDISRIFRNLFWVPFLLIGFFITIGLLFSKKNSFKIEKNIISNRKLQIGAAILIGIIFIGTFTSLIVNSPNTLPKNQNTATIDKLTLMTYNIQLGVNKTGSKSYDQQLKFIIDVNPDIIALQESDSAKIGGGNSDVVRYFAEKLGYYSYYGPKKVAGTYGTAILSRYPIENAISIFTYSDQDEIGTAYIQIEVGGKTFNIFNNHPAGSGDAKLAHITGIMKIIDGLENVISMGDFNSRENSTYYNASTEVLIDTWLSVYPNGVGNGLNMSRRIDHIFVSPGFSISGSTYVTSPKSMTDHPVYWTVIEF